jgi:DNA-binding LacI/PurR family transcriptional regulator
MRQAIEHLLHLGHRRIAYFGPPAGVAEVRLQLFKSMLAEHRVKADASLIFRVDPTAEQGFRLAECVLERRSKPTAIVAVNDMVAIGAMMALQEHGLTLPDDMSIIGIDDLPFASIVRPTLSTIHQPKNELGRLAAKRLLGRINREFCQYRVISLPTRLIVRDSTAHVPSRNSKQ